MKLTISQDTAQTEVEITIKCGLIDEKLQRLIDQIRLCTFSITAKKEGAAHVIPMEEVYYCEALEERTFLYCEKDVYECGQRLYELETQLADTSFIRVSKSVILNIDHLACVRPMAGLRLEAQLENGEKLAINRHYVGAFKEKFGL